MTKRTKKRVEGFTDEETKHFEKEGVITPPVPEKKTDNKKISGEAYAGTLGLGNRIKFVVRKMFKDETHTQKEWKKLFEEKGIISQ